MPVPPATPSLDEISALARVHGITLTDEEAAAFRRMTEAVLVSCRHVDRLPAAAPTVKYPRPAGARPPRAENPYNAWQWRAEIRGAPDGPLAGVRVGVKDFICVAGLPMLLSRNEGGFVPDIDATAVERLLDAGATILGKTIASDGAGIEDITDPSPFVTVRNPRKPTHAPGGSSNGSAVALAAGDIELALGTDQGGSVRIPASWCGVVGLRPSYGLVPYTGIVASDMTMSVLGPLATRVEMIARGLNAIAGPDPLDPRQRGFVPPDVDYTTAIGRDASGLRVAVLREGFCQDPWEIGLPGSDAAVDNTVRATLAELQARGALVEEVSIPAHIDAAHIFHAMYNEGNAAMAVANDVGTNFLGYYNVPLMEAVGALRWGEPNDLSPARKSTLVIAEYLRRHHHGRDYAHSQNAAVAVRAAYDVVLEHYHVIATPTVPILPSPIPPGGLAPDEAIAFAMRPIGNTCQMGVTGHPAISVPCGRADSLPIGLQFIGRHMDDWTVLMAADIVERLDDWRNRQAT